jgi:hypothetical protein
MDFFLVDPSYSAFNRGVRSHCNCMRQLGLAAACWSFQEQWLLGFAVRYTVVTVTGSAM